MSAALTWYEYGGYVEDALIAAAKRELFTHPGHPAPTVLVIILAGRHLRRDLPYASDGLYHRIGHTLRGVGP